MEKIKINMTSGTSLEKPLVTAFKSNGASFVVFDNEMNGTMGLPIILVTKLENNKLVLIPDAEWNAVKETLRLIIAGNQVDYINVEGAIAADDMFFKQLTLPVASFETLKANYKPIADGTIAANPNPALAEPTAVNQEPVSPVNPAPMSSVGPMPELNNQSVSLEPQQPISNVVEPSLGTPLGEMQTPTVEPVTPIMPEPVAPAQVVSPVEPVSEVAAPIVQEIPENNEQATPVDFTADKEAFLKACENMFDALVAKFKN